ncbi:hypothetical protein N0V88_005371 [Collariella sp. IMI 366227]|nr:hypothetical protein N0V88_005371 [Collariella sp. IMI 366227]
MGQTLLPAALLALAVVSARAASVAYVTDLPLFDQLTYNNCPEAVTELQSCVCTKNKNFGSISSKVSASIAYSCGSTASEDQASAATVLSAYCNPDSTFTFATPTAVSTHITEIPEFSYMAPCAQSALYYAIGTMSSRCPTQLPALASCACFKNQNSLVVSQVINTSAKSSCSGHMEDVSSAQAMFAAYCLMNNGTTSFPVPTNPPGDREVTYYITDLPQYSSLAPCAANALSYVINYQTNYMCAEGPQALASCVCIKEGMSNDVLKVLTSSVKSSCESTATEDISSAVAVFDYYCSAAQAKVTAAGVSASIEQTYPASRAPGGPQETGGSNGGGNGGTGNGNGNGNSDSNGGSNGGTGGSTSGDSSSSKKGPSTPLIVGAVVGVVGGLALLGAIIFFIIKTRWQAELPSDSVAVPPPSPSPSTLKTAAAAAVSPARTDTVSPASTHPAAFTPPPNQAELSGQSALYPPRAELGTGAAVAGSPPPPSPGTSELYGQGVPNVNRPELAGQGAMYAAPPPGV